MVNVLKIFVNWLWRAAPCGALLALATGHALAGQLAEYDFRVIVTKDEPSMLRILKQLDAGADFGTMAKEHSIDRNSAKAGGLIKYVNVRELHRVFVDELENLVPGERSRKPRKSEFGWFVIKLESARQVEDDRLATKRAYEEMAEREERARREVEEARTRFESCARRAASLEGEVEEIERRTAMHDAGSGYDASELRRDQRRLERKVDSFNGDCSNIRFLKEFTKVCSHPAYRSQWCDSRM